MKKIELVSIRRNIPTTSAQPFVCVGSDNNLYYTKFVECREGSKELINEFIAYNLAKLLKLPIPEGVLIDVTKEYDNIFLDDKVVTIKPNLAYGSKQLKYVQSLIDDNFLRECENKQDLLSVLVFDHIIDNNDRNNNVTNMLYRYGDKIVFIIDHGRIFDIGTLWNEVSCIQRKDDEVELKSFESDTLYGRIYDNITLKDYKDECLDKFSKIQYNDLELIFESIPSEWNCSEKEKDACLEYLCNRFKQYKSIVDKILSVRR